MKKRKIIFEYPVEGEKEPVCKKRNYPTNYEDFLVMAHSFFPNKSYKLIEKTVDREIEDKEDFDLMTRDLKLDTIKVKIVFDENETNDNKNINK